MLPHQGAGLRGCGMVGIFFLDDLVTPDRDGVRSSLTGDVVTGHLSPVILDALAPGCRAG